MVCFFGIIARLASKRNFSAQNFHSISTHANVNHSVIVTRRAHQNAARPFHLESLLDEHLLIGFGHSVRYHPRGGASRRRARGWVLAVVEHHASVQPGRGIDSLA